MESYPSDSSFTTTFTSESSIENGSSPQQFPTGPAVAGARATNIKCRYFMNNGYCFYGDSCQFIHVASNGFISPSYQKQDSSFYSEDDSAFGNSNSNTPSTFVPGSASIPAAGSSSGKSSKRLYNKSTSNDPSADMLQQQFRRMRLLQNANNDTYNQSNQPKPPRNLQNLQFFGNKADKTSYFMTQQMRMELQKQRSLLLTEKKDLGLPDSIENYHGLFPLEDVKSPSQGQRLLGYNSSCFRVINSKDGLHYCMRRIHGFRLLNPKAVSSVEKWKKLQNTNLVQLKEVFTTKAFGDTSLVFIYTYYPGAETLMSRHFTGPGVRSPTSNSTDSVGSYWNNQNSTSSNYNNSKSTQKVMPERLIWSYIIQLTASIRMIHSMALSCRIIDPTKVLLIGNSRLRLNCAGILDALTSDSESISPAMISHYQQEDLVALGKLILALACYSIEAVQRDNVKQSLEFVTRNYSNDLKTLIWHLISSQVTSNPHSINEVMPVIGARFYSQLDSTQARSDLLESELFKEMDNGRLLRILTKLGTILERAELNMDMEWSETGDRYLLKLFRDYLFHQVTDTGCAWIDFAHIVSTLNKLDAGSTERICLSSRDEQSILVVSYHDLKACMETAFSELIQSSELT